VGLGNIGSRVAAIANAFGMKVMAYTSKEPSLLPSYIHKGTMAEVLEQSDVVSLHCPLTDNTHHLICRDTLKLMKPTAILINTGRGPLVCEEDVAEALNTGSLYAYCADVLSKEPAEASNPLLKCPAAYITPHIAWATEEARRRLVDVAVGNVCAFVGGTPQNVISA
jgi:glycerate dehydrogenase